MQGKMQGGNRLAVVKSTDSDPVFGLLAVLDSPEYEDKLEKAKRCNAGTRLCPGIQ